MDANWYLTLKRICDRYDIDIDNLGEIINDPKVVPMLRGKSFEFFAAKHLRSILPDTFKVMNPKMNAQSNEHDVDIEIVTPKNKTIRVECKLAKKGSFKIEKTGNPSIQVKCMRSRTLGSEKVAQLAPLFGIPLERLQIHNDQYRPTDFDFVITSLGNAFFDTDDSGLYYWNPEEESQSFLKKLEISSQQAAYGTMFFADARQIAVTDGNSVSCSRKKCTEENCGFIPNYPKITFDGPNNAPAAPWYPIQRLIEFI